MDGSRPRSAAGFPDRTAEHNGLIVLRGGGIFCLAGARRAKKSPLCAYDRKACGNGLFDDAPMVACGDCPKIETFIFLPKIEDIAFPPCELSCRGRLTKGLRPAAQHAEILPEAGVYRHRWAPYYNIFLQRSAAIAGDMAIRCPAAHFAALQNWVFPGISICSSRISAPRRREYRKPACRRLLLFMRRRAALKIWVCPDAGNRCQNGNHIWNGAASMRNGAKLARGYGKPGALLLYLRPHLRE